MVIREIKLYGYNKKDGKHDSASLASRMWKVRNSATTNLNLDTRY